MSLLGSNGHSGQGPSEHRFGGSILHRAAAWSTFLCLCVLSVRAAVVAMPSLAVGVPGVDPGEILLSELNCVACHDAAPAVRARLSPKPGPLLGDVTVRLRLAYLRVYLLDPLKARPGTTMPDVLHRLPEPKRRQTVDLLLQFLASLTPPTTEPAVPTNATELAQGRMLYHEIGCVACHAPREPAPALFTGTAAPTDPATEAYVLNQIAKRSEPLSDLAAQFTVGQLTQFLLNPVRVRPGGRMPSLNLIQPEAEAIAAYLCSWPVTNEVLRAAEAQSGTEMPFTLNPAEAREGRKQFVALGCAACHELGAPHAAISSTLKAKPLEALDLTAPGGCLSPNPAPDVPRYALSPAQRKALITTLTHRAALGKPLPPARRVATTLVQLNCYACHSRAGYGGPTAYRSDYFRWFGKTDLGDEGRIPPALTDVGVKLRPDWLREVLIDGGAVRPYMATRMPQFGATNVASLVTAFAAADAGALRPVPLPTPNPAAGRQLVGAHGYSCILCHRFGGQRSLTISVMDMTKMARRLQWPWFHDYLLNPQSLRPGTRMTSFWTPGKKATVTNVLGGDPEKQVAAIWSYLQMGARAPSPEGLPSETDGSP